MINRITGLSTAIEEAYAFSSDEAIILDTLEFYHEDLVSDLRGIITSTPIRVVNNTQSVLCTLETTAFVDGGRTVLFFPYNISYTPAEQNKIGMGRIQITIDNVSNSILEGIDIIDTVKSPLYITYRPYLSTDTLQPHIDPPPVFEAEGLVANNKSITIDASFGKINNRQFPYRTYDNAFKRLI